MSPLYQDRRQAGRALGDALRALDLQGDLLVLALPRGGVPVAYEVALALDAPLDLLLVRKIGVPGYPELAMGAAASGSEPILNRSLIAQLGIREQSIRAVVEREQAELERQETLYRGSRPVVKIEGRTVIVVDDGLATGASMTAGLEAVSARNPRELIVAVPVGARETCVALGRVAHRVVCAADPKELVAVGAWYRDFRQISDAEVRDLLSLAEAACHARKP